MPPAPLASRALEDQLRRMQLQIDALERRMPTGDAVVFDPTLTTGGSFPTFSTYAEYIRMNNMVTYNIELTVTGVGAPGGSTFGLTMLLPHSFDFVSGIWTLQRTTLGVLYVAASGVVTEADASYGANRVLMCPTQIANDATASNLSDDTITFLDLSATIAGGGTAVYANSSWAVGDKVLAMFNARIPDGS